jgi:hypothetical protein
VITDIQVLYKRNETAAAAASAVAPKPTTNASAAATKPAADAKPADAKAAVAPAKPAAPANASAAAPAAKTSSARRLLQVRPPFACRTQGPPPGRRARLGQGRTQWAWPPFPRHARKAINGPARAGSCQAPPAASRPTGAPCLPNRRPAPLPQPTQDMDVPATVQASKKSGAAVADTAAVIEEEVIPKAKIIVTTTVQPLTEDEAAVVYGTTKSSYFDSTFRTVSWEGRKGAGRGALPLRPRPAAPKAPTPQLRACPAHLAAPRGRPPHPIPPPPHPPPPPQGTKNMGLELMETYETEQGDPADEFIFPDEAAAGKTKGPVKKSANATDLDATSLAAVPLTQAEKDAVAREDARNARAAALRSGAGSVYGPSAGAVARALVVGLFMLVALV